MATDTKSIAGPAIRAVNPWVPGNPEKRGRHQLLSDAERAQLAKIATIVRFNKGEEIERAIFGSPQCRHDQRAFNARKRG
jgi:CRP/FNR family transcriptional regulator